MRPVYAKEMFVSVYTHPNWSPAAAFDCRDQLTKMKRQMNELCCPPLVETLAVNAPISSSNTALALLCVTP